MKNFAKNAGWASLLSLLLVTTGCHTGGGRFVYVPFPIAIQFTDETTAGNGFVFLDWQDYPLQDSSFMLYILSRATSATGPWTVIAEIPDRSEYRDTTVTNGINYFYSVQVKRKDGQVSARVIGGPYRPHSDTTPPGSPTNLQAGGGDAIVVLFWNSPGGDAVQFRIYRNTIPSVPTTSQYYLTSVPSSVTNYNDTNVVNRTTYWYVVTAVDGEGNESGPSNVASATPLPDTTPPETTIQSNPPALSNSAIATFTFASNESGSTFQCALDSSGFSACTSPKSYTGLSDGNHTFFVRAIDPSGNVDPTPASYTWMIDTTPPNTIVTGGPPALTNQTSASFNLQSNESPVTFECSLNGSPFSTCPATVNYSNLAEGTHTFAARARDLAGNVDPTPGTHTWRVDTTPPVLTLTQTPPAVTNQTTAIFDWSSSETTYECSLDNAAFAGCPGKPAVYTNLSEGGHIFRVRGTDDAGNTGNPATHNWTVDVTPPRITNLQGPPPFTNSTVANFSWAVTDNLSGVAAVECKTENVDPAFRACTTQTTDVVSGLISGGHTWHIRARDAAGNTTTPLVWNWYVDITGPGVTVLSPNGGENLAVGSELTLRWISLDTVQSGIARHDVFGSNNGGATWYPIAGCQNLPPTAQSCAATPPNHIGSITTQGLIRVVATDNVGNIGEDVSDAVFTISDQTPPTASVIAPVASETVLSFNPYSIQWTSNDNIGIGAHNLLLSLNGGTNFAPIPECTNLPGSVQSCNWDPPDVNNSSAVVRVCATDITTVPPAPHTTCANSGVFSIVYDQTPPEAPTITSGPGEGSFTNQTSATFEFTANDPLPNPSGINRYECKLDSGGFTTCTSPKTYNGISDGAHTFRVRAIDNAGNVGPETVRNWTVDSTPPSLNVTTPNGGEFIPGNASQNIVWTASDAISGLSPTPGSATVEYSTDNGGTWNPADGCQNAASSDTSCPWNVPGADIQQARVRVTVRDRAANSRTDSSDANFTIDFTRPDTSIFTSPPPWTNQTDAVFEFTGTDNFSEPQNLTFECSLDSGPFTPCTSPQAYSGLAPGVHTFNVRATDQAGNTDATPATSTWEIDTTPPTVTVTSPNGGEVVDAPSTFSITWTATDPGSSGLNYFRIDLSTDGGATYPTNIVNNLPAATACPAPPNCSYNWAVDGNLFSGKARVRVTAYDFAGNAGQGASDANFIIRFYEDWDAVPGVNRHPFASGNPLTCPTGTICWWPLAFWGTPACEVVGAGSFTWLAVSGFAGTPTLPNLRWGTCFTSPTGPINGRYDDDLTLGLFIGPVNLTGATSALLTINSAWKYSTGDQGAIAVGYLSTPGGACTTGAYDVWTGFGITGNQVPFVDFQVDLIQDLGYNPGGPGEETGWYCVAFVHWPNNNGVVHPDFDSGWKVDVVRFQRD